jgi:hypothetical protein
MSRIIITEFDGDSSEYDWEQPDTTDNIGAPKGEPKHFRDGEEMLAVKHIVGLLDEGAHFNVRQWVD